MASPAPIRQQAPFNRWWVGALCIVGAIWFAYSGTLKCPFILDDLPGIISNQSIRNLWSLEVLKPSKETVVMMGRPLTNFTLAVNFAFGKLDVRGYHFVNILLHTGAALALFGVIRRTLLLPRWNKKLPSTKFALAAALLWGIHPLTTSAVTYIVQRAEVLVSFFYLLAIYGFVRSVTDNKRWQIFSVGMCVLGMLSKEVMATAPIVILLYDRAFVSDSFNEIFQKRWKYYSALAVTWLVLLFLMLGQPWRGGAVGFSEHANWWDYFRTQAWAVAQYLWLSIVPYPLVFDYGKELITDFWLIFPRGILLITLLVSSIYLYFRKPWLGFLGLAFFIILAPTSSFIPLIYQTIAEHRVYLASSIVLILILITGYRYLPKKAHFGIVSIVALIFILLTFFRNMDYSSPLHLWSDTVKKRPNNERALNNRGNLLAETGNTGLMVKDFNRAIEINPKYEGPFNNRANVWAKLGRYREALADYTRAIELKPDYVEAWHNRANVHVELKQWKEALHDYSKAIELQPNLIPAYFSRGKILLVLNQFDAAMKDFYRVVQMNPNHAGALNNLAWMLATNEKSKELDFRTAVGMAERAVKLTQMRDPVPMGTLAVAYAAAGEFEQAITAAQKAILLGKRKGNRKLVEETEKKLKLYQSKVNGRRN